VKLGNENAGKGDKNVLQVKVNHEPFENDGEKSLKS
jgi:hypothetical protein